MVHPGRRPRRSRRGNQRSLLKHASDLKDGRLLFLERRQRADASGRPSERGPVGASYLHVSSPPSEAQQLLVLAGDEVNGGVLQQGREDEEQTHGHPDVDGLHVGHLQTRRDTFRAKPGLLSALQPRLGWTSPEDRYEAPAGFS